MQMLPDAMEDRRAVLPPTPLSAALLGSSAVPVGPPYTARLVLEGRRRLHVLDGQITRETIHGGAALNGENLHDNAEFSCLFASVSPRVLFLRSVRVGGLDVFLLPRTHRFLHDMCFLLRCPCLSWS